MISIVAGLRIHAETNSTDMQGCNKCAARQHPYPECITVLMGMAADDIEKRIHEADKHERDLREKVADLAYMVGLGIEW